MKLTQFPTKTLIIIFLLILSIIVAILALSSPPSSPPTSPSPSPTSTSPSSPSPQEFLDQTVQQTQNDLLYNQTMQQFLENNPWYQHLPIETNTYRIVYDFDQQLFRIRILVSPSSDQELQTIKQQALQSLEAINIDTTTQPYHFIEP